MTDIRTHKYRCTEVVTHDYGDGPAARCFALAQLAIIPDGSHWQSRPETLKISVPAGTRPGAIWALTLSEEPQ